MAYTFDDKGERTKIMMRFMFQVSQIMGPERSIPILFQGEESNMFNATYNVNFDSKRFLILKCDSVVLKL